MFVVRDTFHPEEDLKRNWSSFAGGWDNSLSGMSFETAEQAKEADLREAEWNTDCEYRFHPAFGGFVKVHYEGLGAFVLEAETLEAAIEEAKNYESGLAITMEKGNGHFYAEQVISFHKVSEGRYIFEIK